MKNLIFFLQSFLQSRSVFYFLRFLQPVIESSPKFPGVFSSLGEHLAGAAPNQLEPAARILDSIKYSQVDKNRHKNNVVL